MITYCIDCRRDYCSGQSDDCPYCDIRELKAKLERGERKYQALAGEYEDKTDEAFVYQGE